MLTSQQRQRLQAADEAHARGDFSAAETICEELVRQSPELLPAWLMGGISSIKAGNVEPGIAKLRRVVELDPNLVLAHYWLALALRGVDAEAAREHAGVAHRLEPQKAETQSALAACYMDFGDYASALPLFESAISLDPAVASYHFGRSSALHALGHRDEALKSLRRAARYGGNPEWSYMLGLAEIEAGNVGKAEAIANDLLGKHPDLAPPHYLRAMVHKERGNDEEMETELGRAIELDPNFYEAHAQLGSRYQTQGRFEEALEEFRTAADLNPEQGSVYYGICNSKTLTEEDADLIERMERVSTESSLHPGEVALLEFALGKSYQDLGNPELAMRHYDLANERSAAFNFAGRQFDRTAFQLDVDRKIALYTPEFLRSQPRGNDSELPILIVGMVRSGTTLMEHILSCHAEIGAGGEQGFWGVVAPQYAGGEDSRVDGEQLSGDAREYVELLKALAPGKPKVTDKNPANVMELGLIHLALPNARILHMRRHPVDTMLSIYTTAVRNPPPFACDKANIAFAYEQYQRLVDHWRSVLPSDRFLDVDYEALVEDPKGVTQVVLEFLGLPWDEACARPERNPRVVKTPSLWQVRQPIHRKSVQKWQTYRPWLGPFARYLEE